MCIRDRDALAATTEIYTRQQSSAASDVYKRQSGDSTTTEATADESTEEKPKPEKCASLPKDPREQYPNHEAPGRMPARDWDDNNFWIGDIENHYDPCAPISWIIFRGGLGDAERPAHTGASMTDGIAFYVHGEPVDDMTLFLSLIHI